MYTWLYTSTSTNVYRFPGSLYVKPKLLWVCFFLPCVNALVAISLHVELEESLMH